MPETRAAPWTDEQVATLNEYQAWGLAHPYVCAACPRPLVATPSGWACPGCGYAQGWAYALHVEPEFRAAMKAATDHLRPMQGEG